MNIEIKPKEKRSHTMLVRVQPSFVERLQALKPEGYSMSLYCAKLLEFCVENIEKERAKKKP